MTEAPPPPAAVPPQPPAGAVKAHRGTAVLVLGILGLVCCAILGIVAWVMGNNDLKEMAAGTMDRSGEGLTKAGKICGMIAVILWIVGVVIWVLMMLIGFSTAAANA